MTMLLSSIISVIGINVVILMNTTCGMVLFSANFEDLRKVARKLVSEQLADEIVGLIANLSKVAEAEAEVEENEGIKPEPMSVEAAKINSLEKEKRDKNMNDERTISERSWSKEIIRKQKHPKYPKTFNNSPRRDKPRQLNRLKNIYRQEKAKPYERIKSVYSHNKDISDVSRDQPNKQKFTPFIVQKLTSAEMEVPDKTSKKVAKNIYLMKNKQKSTPKYDIEDAKASAESPVRYPLRDVGRIQPRYKFVSTKKRELKVNGGGKVNNNGAILRVDYYSYRNENTNSPETNHENLNHLTTLTDRNHFVPTMKIHDNSYSRRAVDDDMITRGPIELRKELEDPWWEKSMPKEKYFDNYSLLQDNRRKF